MGIVANLWRHPIKGVGREELASVNVETGRCMPMDRHWAIAHETAKVDFENPEWARCMNFARGARGYELMAVASQFDDATGLITLTHPKLETLVVNPDTDGDALVDWVAKISNPDRAMPARVFKADRGMTDSSHETLSIHTTASMDDLAQTLGQPLDQRRFRGNIWLDGYDAWSEFDWLGKSIRIGTAEFEITKPVERCMATTVNPDTGVSDADTLGTLNGKYGHQDFGVFAKVTKSGTINTGDKAELI
jgi:uncharacterized protein YcbX